MTNPMPDAPHIKRFEEHIDDHYEYPGGRRLFPEWAEKMAIGAMLNDLAEHIERLEEQNKALWNLYKDIAYPPTDPTQDGNHTL